MITYHYRIIIGAAVLSLAYLPPNVFAEEEMRVTAVVEKRNAEVGEEIPLALNISGSKANLLRPRLPDMEGFDSFFHGRANRFTFVNGRSENNTTFSYVLVPKRPGKFTLPPIEVQADDRVFRTDPIEFQITGAAQSPAAGTVGAPQRTAPARQTSPANYGAKGGVNPQSSPLPQASVVSAPKIRTSTQGSDRDVFLLVTADRSEAYPNEQVLLTYAVYTRYSARAEQFEKDPNLGGLWVEEIPIEKNYQPERLTLNGMQYLKADIRRLAVFPTSSGILDIDPGVFRVSIQKENRSSGVFDDFFNDSFFGGSVFARRETKLLTAEPLKLTVRPLPEQGKPEDFSGMVGQFRMTTQIDKRSVKQNEPILMILTIEGQGNMEMVARPRIPETRNIKFYDTDSQNQFIKDRSGVRGRKIFEITFIPMEAGDLEIPALDFNFFDPRSGEYQILRSQPYQIKVSPAPYQQMSQISAEQGDGLKKTIQGERRDIYFVEENYDPDRKRLDKEALLSALFAANVFLSLIALFLFVKRVYEERLDSNISMKRSLFARRNLQKGMKNLRKLARAKTCDKKREYFDQASKLLNRYIAEKFNLSEQGLTMGEIAEHLLDKGFPSEGVERIEKFYRVCDEVRFTSAEVPEIRMEDFKGLTDELSAFLERK